MHNAAVERAGTHIGSTPSRPSAERAFACSPRAGNRERAGLVRIEKSLAVRLRDGGKCGISGEIRSTATGTPPLRHLVRPPRPQKPGRRPPYEQRSLHDFPARSAYSSLELTTRRTEFIESTGNFLVRKRPDEVRVGLRCGLASKQEETRRQVMEIVAAVAEVPAESISPEALLSDLDVDSLRGLRIVAEVERRWGIVIGEDEIGGIRSMGDILAIVENHST